MTAPAPRAPESDYARRRRRPWLWLAAALAVSAGVITVAWQLDARSAEGKAARSTPGGPITDLRPAPLTDVERRGGTGASSPHSTARLDEGAWVQVAGPDGRVKQQYTAAQINPLPDKRIAMKSPQAVLYGTNGRVVTMRSDTMTAAVPKGELQSGRLEGRVIIRVYTPQAGRPVDLAVDAADIVIEAPEAEFDADESEVRADRSVTVTSEALSFVGEGLYMLLSEDGRSIERLTVDRPLSPIRIERSAAMLQERSKGLRPAAAPDAQDPTQAADPERSGGAAPGAGERASSEPVGGDRTGGAATPRGGAQSEGSQAAHTPAGKVLRPYLLTLTDNVRVVSQEQDRRITMTGQKMQVLFTMESGVGEGLVVVPSPGGPLAMQAPLVAIAAAPSWPVPRTAAPASDEFITITYAGRLVLEPAPSDVPPLAQPKAVRIDMTGAPARVEDSKSQAVMVGESVRFESEVEDVRLAGTTANPATLESPDFGIRAPVLHLNRMTGKGGVEGPGALRLGEAGKRPVRVAWSQGARFGLAPGSQNAEGSFRTADFAGNVEVRSGDFSLDAGALSVEAAPVGTRDVLRRIVATDGVRATDLGERQGRLVADRIEMTLAPDARGDAIPRTMQATGAVMVADTQQTIWAEGVRAAFAAPRPAQGNAPADAPMRADVSSVVADGPVELLLKDGTRVWAGRMEGDALAGTARLSGPNVLVVRGNSVIDQVGDLQVQETPGRLGVAGPGRVSYYEGRLLPETRDKLGRPTLRQVPIMQSTWRDGLVYADRAVAGKFGAPDRGLLLMQGGVKVRASRSPLEAEALDADEVHIEIMPQVAGVPGAPGASGAVVAQGDTRTAPADMGSVARMIARGNVRIETQEWRDTARTGEPRLFRLLAGNATYDVVEALCSVEGAGTILVNDPAEPVGAHTTRASGTPFSPEGVTKFTWQRSLGMKNAGPGLTTVALDGSVQMQHLGPDDASTGALAADHLEATVRSRPEREERPADGAPIFGAGATIEHILARGRVTVRTPEFDIETGEFSLDEAKQVAQLSATPGRTVTIVKRGAETVRAESATWDIAAGTIKVLKVRGAMPR